MAISITRIRARSIEGFGELVHHKGEDGVYGITGRIEVHTGFYDAVVIGEASRFSSIPRWATPGWRPTAATRR